MTRWPASFKVRTTRSAAQVVELIDSFDTAAITRLATATTAARLRGERVDVVRGLADVVPTETLLEALGDSHASSGSVRDVGLLAAVIGRGHPSDRSTDDAVERLSQRFASHPSGPIAVLSMLYQNHDATAALLIETVDALTHGRPRRSAMTEPSASPRARRASPTPTSPEVRSSRWISPSRVSSTDSAHTTAQGRPLAEAIIAGIKVAITTSGYTVLSEAVERHATGRPTILPMEPGR